MARLINSFFALLIAVTVGVAVAKAGPRDRLTVEEMFGEIGRGPVDNRYFMPMGNVAPARHALSATLAIPETERWDFGKFPAVEVQMITSNGRLIPVIRDILHDTSGVNLLSIIFSPGRVWSEAGDKGLSRASFPFVLSGLISNKAHNGLATFLYDETTVSSLVFQIVQETAVGHKFDAWGTIPISLHWEEIDNRDRMEEDYTDELERRLPSRPLSALAGDFGKAGQEAFDAWPESYNESVSGLVLDGVVYVGDCKTRFGPYPYCAEMRHGVQSMTKSLGGLLAMLRLAQKYGDRIFGLKIKDYLPVPAEQDGWADVTFADALNMTTGIGSAPTDYTGIFEDSFPVDRNFRAKLSAREKLAVAFTSGHYPWGPGKVFRYRSMDSFILAAAMDGFLKSREGSDADIWHMVLEEVLRPIGIYRLPMIHSLEPDATRGIPIFGEGIFPTYGDIAKIALLLQSNGQFNGEQLLSANKLKEALYKTEIRGKFTPPNSRLPGVSYHMSLWHPPIELETCVITVPMMSGMGGNIAQLLPSGTVTFFLQDGGESKAGQLATVADSLRSECQ